jgi:hypothetical protein
VKAFGWHYLCDVFASNDLVCAVVDNLLQEKASSWPLTLSSVFALEAEDFSSSIVAPDIQNRIS